MSAVTEQYRKLKLEHADKLLLFRMGDFYEMFGEDARTGARILGLTLTMRNKTTPMSGFPYHQLETYLQKLLSAGQRVAICEVAV